MRTLHRFLGAVLGLALLAGPQTYAQTKLPTDTDEENFKTVTTFGITTNTNAGLIGGFVYRQSKVLPGTLFGRKQHQYLSLEVVNIKHPKEVQSAAGSFGSRFVYGKENYLFVIRPQYGREITLFQRNADEGVAVNAIFAVGPSLGIIKPYYVKIQEGNRQYSIPYSETIDANGIRKNLNVVDKGGFFEGFGQSKFTVGVNIKTAVSFELSAFRNNTTGVEIGFLTEIFPQKIIIIPNGDPRLGSKEIGNRGFFTSGYITLFFGSKK
jgi:hypothetical protein